MNLITDFRLNLKIQEVNTSINLIGPRRPGVLRFFQTYPKFTLFSCLL